VAGDTVVFVGIEEHTQSVHFSISQRTTHLVVTVAIKLAAVRVEASVFDLVRLQRGANQREGLSVSSD